ncbi:MAG TPA: DEAD/DEAH box helicase, partial [Polyangiaceae bacterium]
LDARAAKNLVRYVRDQDAAPNVVPTDQRIVVEQFLDEVGDYRVCLLSPHGARVHIPLALCMQEKARRELFTPLEAVWSDDGIVFRFPERDEPPELSELFPGPEEVDELLLHALSDTPLFAAHFRECAARALLLPRRTPQRRTPLWAQRKRSAGLLAVVSKYQSFPIVLETYRECLQDVFDVPALTALLTEVAQHKIRVVTTRGEKPSPFAVSLLFNYVGNFMYDGDAPLLERKAAALSIDPTQLRELLGEAELKDLLEPQAIDEAAAHAGRKLYPPRHPDDLHDLLLLVGDLSLVELRERMGEERDQLLGPLLAARRALALRIAGEERVIAVEDMARFRDAVGVMPPAGLPSAYLTPVADPLSDIALRFARTHGPFSASEVASRYALPVGPIRELLDRAFVNGRLLRGELHPQKSDITYCDPDVMRAIKRRSLASLRQQMEAVDGATYTRFLLRLHGIGENARGTDALRNALSRLEGASIDLGVLEREMLPARIRGFTPSDLDALLASGELVWRGVEPSARGAGRIALYFRESFAAIAPTPTPVSGELAETIRAALRERGAAFFYDIQRTVGGFAPDVLAALWELIWAGEVTNDTLQPLRSIAHGDQSERRRGVRVNKALPGSEGRFSLLQYEPVSETERRLELVERLLLRHGILVRDAIKAEGISGGFSSIYEVLKAMEDNGRVRRGYFVEGLGAAQFVSPGLEERLRGERIVRTEVRASMLASSDPASPFGLSLPWPSASARPMRVAGANVVIGADGRALAWIGRHESSVLTFFREQEREREADAHSVAATIQRAVDRGERRAYLVARIDGEDAERTVLGRALIAVGFRATARGLLKRGPQAPVVGARVASSASADEDEPDVE